MPADIACIRRHNWGGAPLVLLIAAFASPAAGQTVRPEIDARVIERFEIGSDETRFGPFTFIGGLELTARSRAFGGISGLRVTGEDRFIGVMDTGYWFEGRLMRDGAGRLEAVADFTITAMRGDDGQATNDKAHIDAEGLAIAGEDVLVSFERDHRVERFALDDFPPERPGEDVGIVMPPHELRRNAGLEAIAVQPDAGALGGAAVVVAENSINDDGDLFAAVLSGPRRGVFFVRRDPPFAVTDAAFLADGDLMLLERRFGISDGVGMRIRLIEGQDIEAGATVDGDTLLDVGFGHQIDNMEAIDIVAHADGSTRMLLASDDNHSILQRTLILEFRVDQAVSSRPAGRMTERSAP